MDAHFAQVCSTARAAGARAEGHPVYWQTLREIQKEDERKCQGMRAGHRLMPKLKTATHINKTGFSRMRVPFATEVVCIETARIFQLLRLGLVHI